MGMNVKKFYAIGVLIALGAVIAAVAVFVDWRKTPQLEGVATTFARDFYAKLFAQNYHAIFAKADEELIAETPEGVFTSDLRQARTKLTEAPIAAETVCTATETVSLRDKIELKRGRTARISAICTAQTANETLSGKFVWSFFKGELKLLSFTLLESN